MTGKRKEEIMVNNEKKIRVISWVIIILGSLVVGGVTGALEITETMKIGIVIVWLIFIFLIICNINLLWNRSMFKKVSSLSSILSEDHDPDRYIAEINALLEGTKSEQFRQIRLLNLGAAYCDKEDYRMAKELLMQVETSKLAPINQTVYWIDLALVHFYLKENQEACAIMEQQKDAFSELKDHQTLGGSLALLTISEQLAMGNAAEAKKLLDDLRPRWENDRNARDFDNLDKQCAEQLRVSEEQ